MSEATAIPAFVLLIVLVHTQGGWDSLCHSPTGFPRVLENNIFIFQAWNFTKSGHVLDKILSQKTVHLKGSEYKLCLYKKTSIVEEKL
jgi:hypothetical protein